MTKIWIATGLLLLAFCAPAQDYRPFYGPTDLIFDFFDDITQLTTREHYRLRVDSIGTVDGDDAWFFPQVARPVNAQLYELEKENDFGAYCVQRPGGRFVFMSLENNDSIVLETQLPLNAPWTFHAGSNVTAEITQKSTTFLFNSVSDSLLRIEMSDNTVFLLTQNNGALTVYNPAHYFRGAPIRSYSRNGPAFVPRLLDYYDWALGGTIEEEDFPFDGKTYWLRSTVTGKTIAPDSSTVSLQLNRRTVSIDQFNNVTDDTSTVQLTVSDSSSPYLFLSRMEYRMIDTNLVAIANTNFDNPTFSGRQTQQVLPWIRQGNTALPPGFSVNVYEDYTTGIGRSRFENIGGSTTGGFFQYRRTTCFTNFPETEGQCTDLDSVIALPVNPAFPNARITVYPNPAKDRLQVDWEGIPAGKKRLKLYDLQGRMVNSQVLTPARNGRLTLDLNLQDGLYFLALTADEEVVFRQKVLISE
ncbi:MAG: T9SS type A sorting domain-containing protein [Bacteroidota bacterium]